MPGRFRLLWFVERAMLGPRDAVAPIALAAVPRKFVLRAVRCPFGIATPS